MGAGVLGRGLGGMVKNHEERQVVVRRSRSVLSVCIWVLASVCVEGLGFRVWSRDAREGACEGGGMEGGRGGNKGQNPKLGVCTLPYAKH
jgi:nitrate reductase NapE component